MTRDEVLQLKVIVVAGGWSSEHDISMQSGEACQAALTAAGFKGVDLVDVAEPDFIQRLLAGNYDVVFVAMHGSYGEDGCIQGLLETLHIPYTFSGVLGSALACEKTVAKILYADAGIPTPKGVTLAATDEVTNERLDQIVDELGLPLFVKPVSNGSSFGVTSVAEETQLKKAIADAAALDSEILIEERIMGTEITVPVIGNDDPQALPIVEIVTGADYYDLKVKYEPASMHHVVPARLEAGVYARAQKLAIKAHKALHCLGASRSDFIVKDDGTPVILETNTIPGMTERSLLPDSARHGGIEFPELCTRFIEFALEAHGKGER
ncbi:MAG: D-alanine--D-alanine ligase family protein [Tractidigestivibacter sp.]|jgi:D-alanine-D-alanine ligase|uniref:D-alanine--D-alanine ligase family protein n=1 Tax=Tractidigestivibacter sp. TaxID=2847320 RepID=UPI003D90C1E7